MEENYFDKALKEKMLDASAGEARPDWGRMRVLLEQNGLTKRFSFFKTVLPAALVLLSLLNAGVIIYLFTEKTAPKQQVSSDTPPTKTVIHHVDTVYRYDTVVSKKTVYVVDTILIKKTVFAEQENPSGKSNGAGQYNGNRNVTKRINNVPEYETNRSGTGKRENYKSETLLSAGKHDSVPDLKKQLEALVENSNKVNNPVSGTERQLHGTNRADSLNAGKNPEKEFQQPAEQPEENTRKIKNNGKPLTVSFFAGALFNKIWFVDKNFTKGTAFQYGLVPSVLFNNKYEVDLGVLFCNNSYKLKENPSSDFIGNYPGIIHPDSVYEIYATANYYSFPLNFRYHIYAGNHFYFSPELGVEYYLYKTQEFQYEYEDDDGKEHETKITINNGFNGFGHFTAGLGISYVLFDKLHLGITPRYYFPAGKTGAEKVSYSMFSTGFSVKWEF